MNGSRPLEFIIGAVPKSEKVAHTIQIFRFGPVKMRRNVQTITVFEEGSAGNIKELTIKTKVIALD